ncbi:hypothetical protein [Flocculibacter collagenilyticus]|uniref:hypothetical protein n=1 Tax=Flocculibacter collagenilyticus TaxID=2744479 RepID=UPI001F2684C0|nr:hypothetical protein [Flocculibacter collagenilyticus]
MELNGLEMKSVELKNVFKISALAAAIALTGCGGDIVLNAQAPNVDVAPTQPTNPAPTTPTEQYAGTYDAGLSQAVTSALGNDTTVQVISGRITQDTVLKSGAMYALSGPVFVGNDKADSATLTIEPGVVVFGRSGNDYLVVSRDSKINAVGSKDKPIIMTSLQDVVGDETSAGQWGGMVLLGNAPSNKCPSDGSDCALQVEGVEEGAVFGGTNWEDNSGALKYVVVKYAGYEIAPDNELNGITFGGVGSATSVDYIQVHANADDGVEFFGGAVNVKHLVLTGNQDDSIDWDNGYRGKMQHVFVQHDQNAGDANRAIEADNDGSNPDKEPMSNPTISNITIMGNNFDGKDDSEGVYLREGTAAKIYNMVITGPNEMGECLEVEDNPVSQAHLQNGGIIIENSMMACSNDENFKYKDAGVNLEEWFMAQSGNSITTSPLLSSKGTPLTGSPLLEKGQDVGTNVDGSFFDTTDYIGAFNATEDWRKDWAFGFGGGVVTAQAEAAGCPAGTVAISPADGVTTTCEISGRITSDLRLTANKLYALSGPVFVGNDNADSATLSIDAGVTVFGRSGNDYLVISRGSKINAQGSSTAPIIFTSNQDITGEVTAAGQWGGMVLLGNASSNKCPQDGSDCALQVEGVEEGAVFGGTNDQDNSGTLRYVVVKHAGYEIAPDNELNGITFGGVGNKTTVEYIQVHQNADDGVEFFGGTVNAKYVVLTGNQDDSVDWDNGYRGKMQYVLVKHAADDSDANRAIEGDNDGSTPNKQPQSNPQIANMTIIGNNFDGKDDSEGVYLREGTMAQLSNFVITGPAGMGECFEIEDTPVTQQNATNLDISFTHSVVACQNGENFKNIDETWFLSQSKNEVASKQTDVLKGYFTQFAATPKDFGGDKFFDNADFIGAVKEGNDWTVGWTVGLGH